MPLCGLPCLVIMITADPTLLETHGKQPPTDSASPTMTITHTAPRHTAPRCRPCRTAVPLCGLPCLVIVITADPTLLETHGKQPPTDSASPPPNRLPTPIKPSSFFTNK